MNNITTQYSLSNRERFLRVMRFEPVDRLPLLEWAAYWDKTVDRWYSDGMPQDLQTAESIREYFGLDAHRQYWITPTSPSCPAPERHGAPLISSKEDYERIKKYLYPEPAFDKNLVHSYAKRQESGEMVVWITLEGFFWFPRTLLGIEQHLYSFYDQPELMVQINDDLCAYNLRVINEFCDICVPDFMTFAEDLSYNHGPMLSKNQFDEFIAPYYKRMVPLLRERGVTIFVDTDGNVTEPVGWFMPLGVQGFLPLERMAGVDVSVLRENHSDLRMIGAFDKTVMHLGEERMREEFERLLPVMRQGGFVAAVDHQTPPDVSLDQYRTYVRLLREYCSKACDC